MKIFKGNIFIMNVPHSNKTITKDSGIEFQTSNTFDLEYGDCSNFLFELKTVRIFDNIRK